LVKERNSEKHIIFLSVYPLNESFFIDRFGFETWKKRDFQIHIINIAGIIYPHVIDQLPEYLVKNKNYGFQQLVIYTRKQLTSYLKSLTGEKYSIPIGFRVNEVVSIYSETDTKYIVLRNHIVDLSHHYNVFELIIRNVLSYNISGLIQNVIQKFSDKYSLTFLDNKKINSPFMIGASRHELKKINLDYKDSILVNIKAFDKVRYEKDLKRAKPAFIEPQEYYVLLTNHPWQIHDNILMQYKEQITKDQYSLIINRFLGAVEKILKKPILIAAYPKCTDDENIYQGRPFLKDTNMLVRFSKGVITHHTNAINFAVLNDKPLCLIGLNDLNRFSEFNLYTRAYARELDLPLYFIGSKSSNSFISKNMFSKDSKKYQEFKEKFLSSDNEDQNIFEEIINNLS